ncbi:hypothetical protein BB560_000535, partial [Smittium megazygosporum]
MKKNLVSSGRILDSFVKVRPHILDLRGDNVITHSPLEHLKSSSSKYIWTPEPSEDLDPETDLDYNQQQLDLNSKINNSDDISNKNPEPIVSDSKIKQTDSEYCSQSSGNEHISSKTDSSMFKLDKLVQQMISLCQVPRFIDNGGFWAYSVPSPAKDPKLVYLSPSAAAILGFEDKEYIERINEYLFKRNENEKSAQNESKTLTYVPDNTLSDEVTLLEQILSGNVTFRDLYPISYCYGGHQFGTWAGQLGDGRAMSLFHILSNAKKSNSKEPSLDQFADSQTYHPSEVSEDMINQTYNLKINSDDQKNTQPNSKSETSDYIVKTSHKNDLKSELYSYDGYELALKGSGKTVFSRFADGLAILSSSVREFLISEHMAHLGIPTTRALSLISTLNPVFRDLDVEENGAIVARFSPSWIRFGNIQNASSMKKQIEMDNKMAQKRKQSTSSNDNTVEKDKGTSNLNSESSSKQTGEEEVTEHEAGESLKSALVDTAGTIENDPVIEILDFVIRHHFPEIQKNKDGFVFEYKDASDPEQDLTVKVNKYAYLFERISTLSANLVADWMAVGFCHGVLNTDNMSVLGLTLDYGPFSFMNGYDSEFICNKSDEAGRYAFDQQPKVVLWNLIRLASAMYDYMDIYRTKSVDKNTDLKPELTNSKAKLADSNNLSNNSGKKESEEESKDNFKKEKNEMITRMFSKYSQQYSERYINKLLKKMGLISPVSYVSKENQNKVFDAVGGKYLSIMEKCSLDYTNSFRRLSKLVNILFSSETVNVGLLDPDQEREITQWAENLVFLSTSQNLESSDSPWYKSNNSDLSKVNISDNNTPKNELEDSKNHSERSDLQDAVRDLVDFAKNVYYPHLEKSINEGVAQLNLKNENVAKSSTLDNSSETKENNTQSSGLGLESAEYKQKAKEISKSMDSINPQFVLRNWITEDIMYYSRNSANLNKEGSAMKKDETKR